MKLFKDKKLKVLLSFGLIGAAIFVITFLTKGGVLRDGSSPLKYPVSSLREILFLSRQKTSVAFHIALVGFGLTCAGIFTTDPIYGYPENLPLVLSQFPTQGHLHDLFSLLVFICLPTSWFMFGNYFLKHNKTALALYSTLTAAIMIIAFVLAAIGFKQIYAFVNITGALQRISIITGCVWLCVISLYFFLQNPDKYDDNHILD